jgi:hypothetical protein
MAAACIDLFAIEREELCLELSALRIVVKLLKWESKANLPHVVAQTCGVVTGRFAHRCVHFRFHLLGSGWKPWPAVARRDALFIVLEVTNRLPALLRVPDLLVTVRSVPTEALLPMFEQPVMVAGGLARIARGHAGGAGR